MPLFNTYSFKDIFAYFSGIISKLIVYSEELQIELTLICVCLCHNMEIEKSNDTKNAGLSLSIFKKNILIKCTSKDFQCFQHLFLS